MTLAILAKGKPVTLELKPNDPLAIILGHVVGSNKQKGHGDRHLIDRIIKSLVSV